MPVDPAFGNAGKKIGLEIWRIENLKPVPVEEKTYGTFCSGDSYIILQTKKRSSAFEWHIYFWLGKDTTQDESGVAAYKTVELDDSLGGSPVQHREVQGHESPQFMALFKNVTYMEGGVASGFRHVDPTAHEPRLFHLKGKRNVRCQQVEVSNNSLNDGDVFVLDMGQKIFQWNGSEANKFEKIKGLEISTKIKDQERGGKPILIQLEAKDDNEEFWGALGGKGYKTAQEGGLDEDVKKQPVSLYRVSDASGKMEITSICTGRLVKEFLDTNDVFIVDTGTTLFVWIGKGATKDEKKKGMVYGQEFLTKNNRPNWTPVTRIIEGGETPVFKAVFFNWPQPKVSIMNTPTEPHAPKKVNVDTSALYGARKAAEEKMADDGSGKVQVWRIENFNKYPIEPNMIGQFYAGDSYIVLYEYLVKGKKKWILYFWQGRASSSDEKGTSALLTVQMDDALGGDPVQVRVVQGKEPNHFLSLFKGKMVIHEGGKASAFKNRADKDSYDTDGISLFHIKGTNALNTRAVQVEELARSLNSSDCFVLLTPSTMYVWMGNGSNAEERKCAESIANVLKFKRSVKIVKEGSEPAEFWKALGGKADYPSSKELQVEPRDPRLFNCSNKTGSFVVEEIAEFSQDDLLDDDVMILDSFTEVFVWVGKDSNDVEKKEAFKAALNFVKNSPDGRSKDTPVYRVNAGNEPPNFTCHFLGWGGEVTTFHDPLKKKTGGIEEKAAEATVVKESDFIVDDNVTFSYEELANKKCNVPDSSKREAYLNDADFQRVFNLTKQAFYAQPKWKQVDQKKKFRLF